MTLERYRDEVVSETVDGRVYTSTKLPATRALMLMGRVVRVLGAQGLQALVFKHAKMVEHVAPFLTWNLGTPATFDAIEQTADALIRDVNLPRDLMTNVRVNETVASAKPGPVHPIFDAHFSGEWPHLYGVAAFVLTHNFLGFSQGFRSTSGSHTNDETSTEPQLDYDLPAEE